MCNDIVRLFNSMGSTWSKIKTKYYHTHIYIYIYTERERERGRGRERERAYFKGEQRWQKQKIKSSTAESKYIISKRKSIQYGFVYL